MAIDCHFVIHSSANALRKFTLRKSQAALPRTCEMVSGGSLGVERGAFKAIENTADIWRNAVDSTREKGCPAGR